MSPFDHADASLASGPPFLAVAEPALLLFAYALGAFGGAIGNADALDALCLHRHLVLGGVECGICRDQARSATEPCLMGFDGSDQQVRIAGTPIVDFVVGHNLILGLLQFHHLAEFVWLAGLAFADDLRRGLEQAENLAVGARVAAQDARSGLLHNLPDERHALPIWQRRFSNASCCRTSVDRFT